MAKYVHEYIKPSYKESSRLPLSFSLRAIMRLLSGVSVSLERGWRGVVLRIRISVTAIVLGTNICVNTKFNLLIQLAEFSTRCCFSVLPGDFHPAGYYLATAVMGPVHRNRKNVATAPGSVERKVQAR